MFTLRWTDAAMQTYADLRARAESSLANRKQRGRRKSTRAEGLFKQVHKGLTLLADNPRHPGLATHLYHGLPHPFDPKGKVFEAYAQNQTPGAYRIFWCYGPNQKELTIIAITPHP